MEIHPFQKPGSNKWVHSFVVVNFDLQLGQKVESVFPSNQILQEKYLTAIAYLSFPETTSPGEDDLIYTFKIPIEETNDTKKRRTFLFGYVFFRQMKDISIPRGYLQKSLVILSKFHFDSLFKNLVFILGPLYFSEGDSSIEAAYSNILQWPIELSTSNQSADLPFMGTLIQFTPENQRKFSLDLEIQTNKLNSLTMGHINVYKVFEFMLPKLWILYELVLLCEPIIIISNSPAKSSNIVLQIISMIFPIKYCGDYRPYFTIYDDDYSKFVEVFHHQSTKKHSEKAIILGVTNPLFEKDFSANISNFLFIKEDTTRAVTSKSGNLKGYQNIQGKCEFKSSYTALFDDNIKETTKKLTKGKGNEIAAINNEFLHRHFLEKTKAFLLPLETYVIELKIKTCLNPINIWQNLPTLPTFKESELIQFLLYEGKNEKTIRVYRSFIRTPNFLSWFRLEKKKLDQECYVKYLLEVQRIILSGTAEEILEGKTELQLTTLLQKVQAIHCKQTSNDDKFTDEQEKLVEGLQKFKDLIKEAIIISQKKNIVETQ